MSPDDKNHETAPTPPSVGMTVAWLQLLLIPICIFVLIFLPIDATPRQRPKLSFVAWVALTSGSTIVAGVYGDFRAAIGFLLGPVRYRLRWLVAQSDSFGFASVCAIPAGVGFYLLSMSFMPVDFFVEDRTGKAVFGFLGCKSIEKAPFTCRLGFAGFVAITIFLVYIACSTFKAQA